MKKNIFLLLSFLFILQLIAFAQQKKVDSLVNALKRYDSVRNLQNKIAYDKSDTQKVNILTSLCSELINVSSYDKAKQYAETVLDIAKKIDYKAGESRGYYSIGLTYYYRRKNDESLKYFTESLKIDKERNDKKGISNIYLMLGLLQINKANYKDATEKFMEAIAIKKEINDRPGTAMAYHNIGLVNYYQGNYPTALENYLIGLKIREEINDKRGIAMSLNNIGIVYDRHGKFAEARQNYERALKYNIELGDKKGIASAYNNIGIVCEKSDNDSDALKNYAEALKIKEEIGDKKGIAVTSFNMGTIYSNHDQKDEALKSFSKALKIEREIDDLHGTNRTLTIMGSVYRELKNYEEAKKYLDEGLSIALKIGAKESIVESYGQLLILDSLTGNWREAYTHHREYFRYDDSLINAENSAKMLKSQLQYELQKKEDSTKAVQEKKDLQVQKEMALKALQFEYAKKQAAAKNEEERKQLKYEQQIKEQELSDEYSKKIALADAKQQHEQALNKVLAKENNLMQQNSKNEARVRWLMIAALIGFTAFGINYYRSYRKQKAANSKILKQSEELKTLMQEVHHRVKNNLQLISSLLELQGMRLTDDVAKSAFEEGQSRVQSIAILHHQLYQHDDLHTIELNTFAAELLRQISIVFKKQDQEVMIENMIPETFFDIDVALPLGLILNELATNTFKYANPSVDNEQIQKLLIEIKLLRDSDDIFTLVYKDNGTGLSKTFDLEKAKSLGLRIVTRLSKQLKGTCEYEYDGGAKFSIQFAQKRA